MADVVFLGLGQSSGFDNRDITQVIGQEVAVDKAEVVHTGKFGIILPAAKEPQATFTDVPVGPPEVEFSGPQFSEPPPTMNPEVQYVFVPRASGDLIGPVFEVPQRDVVLGPIGQSNAILNLPTPNGGALVPEQTFTTVQFGLDGPLAPLSLDPASNLPPVGPYKIAIPDVDPALVKIPGGSIIFLVNTNPQRFRTDPFPPAEIGTAIFVGTDPVNGLFPKRVRYMPDTATVALRGLVANIVSLDLDVASFDTIICEASFPVPGTIFDRFVIEDAPIVRVTPVLEIILG